MILCCGDGHVVNVVGEGDVGGFRERKDDKKRKASWMRIYNRVAS